MQKVALVTGGRTGIGLGIAESLAEAGHKVIVTSRTYSKNMPKNIELIECDICKEKGIEILEKYLSNKAYVVQTLVNNIGHTLEIMNPFCSVQEWQDIINVNLLSCIRATNLCVPGMSTLDYGRIINVASNAGIENSGPVTFTTTKAALVAYTRSIGRVLAVDHPHIVANAILPGIVVTPEGHWGKITTTDPERAKQYIAERCPLGRFGEIKEIAALVAFLASAQNSFSHGSIIPIDGGQAKGLMAHTYLE